MNKEDVQHLAALARIKVTEAELTTLSADLNNIVSYVSTVSEIAADGDETSPEVGARYNVLRADVVTNEPNQFTDDVLAEMPATEGRFMKVKKILSTDE